MRFVFLFLVLMFIVPVPGRCERAMLEKWDAPTDSTYIGDARVTYIINGRRVSIRNTLQTDGATYKALHLNAVSQIPDKNLVRINFTNSLTNEVFDFIVAGKGTTTIIHYIPTISIQAEKKGVYMSDQLVNYNAENVKVKIHSNDGKRVSGKFSGKFISDKGSVVYIRNGSFDLPYNPEAL
jgi:hypothetical protein